MYSFDIIKIPQTNLAILVTADLKIINSAVTGFEKVLTAELMQV